MAIWFGQNNPSVGWGRYDYLEDGSVFTFSAWVYLLNVTQDHCILSCRNAADAGALDGFTWFADDTAVTSGRTDTYTFYVQDADNTIVTLEGATGAAVADRWQHVLVTFLGNDASGLNLYVDGVLDANSPVATTSVTDLGAANRAVRSGMNDAGTQDMAGGVAEIAIWSRILSANEIALLASRHSCTFPAFQRDRVFFYEGKRQSTQAEMFNGSSLSTPWGVFNTTATSFDYFNKSHPPLIYPKKKLRRNRFKVPAAPAGDLLLRMMGEGLFVGGGHGGYAA